MEPVEAHYTRQIQKQNKTIYIYIYIVKKKPVHLHLKPYTSDYLPKLVCLAGNLKSR